jgi:hypothetical protein
LLLLFCAIGAVAIEHPNASASKLERGVVIVMVDTPIWHYAIFF